MEEKEYESVDQMRGSMSYMNVDDPAKFERYQAEALVHQHCPIDALLGIICYSDKIKASIENTLSNKGINLDVYVRTGWYF